MHYGSVCDLGRGMFLSGVNRHDRFDTNASIFSLGCVIADSIALKGGAAFLSCQRKQSWFRWCFFTLAFLREISVADKSLWRAESQSNFPQPEEQDMHTYCHFLFFSVCGRKAFKCGVTGYCAAHHLFTPPLSLPLLHAQCMPLQSLTKRGGKRRTGQVMRGLRDKNQPDFYLGRAPGAGSSSSSSRPPLPSNHEKRDEFCNMVDWFSP